jgi:hypothetical protein
MGMGLVGALVLAGCLAEPGVDDSLGGDGEGGKADGSSEQVVYPPAGTPLASCWVVPGSFPKVECDVTNVPLLRGHLDSVSLRCGTSSVVLRPGAEGPDGSCGLLGQTGAVEVTLEAQLMNRTPFARVGGAVVRATTTIQSTDAFATSGFTKESPFSLAWPFEIWTVSVVDHTTRGYVKLTGPVEMLAIPESPVFSSQFSLSSTRPTTLSPEDDHTASGYPIAGVLGGPTPTTVAATYYGRTAPAPIAIELVRGATYVATDDAIVEMK